VLRAVTIPPADLHSLSSYYYAVCGRMCMSSVQSNVCGHILPNNMNSTNAKQREEQ